ncbi:hypothetical protein [Geodermatophilus sp. Leaf369]|uniref:hypothetical protein n=1 Tax=Geodermatophilus sp. Leaf369 TaxID=1736354 RepID=UPI0012FA45BC|nr:hypothetical protein [Geodermatophilus sp. Leaf369]
MPKGDPIETYLALIDAVSDDAELLQVQYVDHRNALASEWIEQAVFAILTGAAGSLVATITYSGRGVLDQLLARTRASENEPAVDHRALALELISAFSQVREDEFERAILHAARRSLEERGIDEELVNRVVNNMREALRERNRSSE